MGDSTVTGTAPHIVGEPVPPWPKSWVEPVQVRFWDGDAHTNVRRIVAYRGDCECGWRGRPWRTWLEANAERRYHAGEHEA